MDRRLPGDEDGLAPNRRLTSPPQPAERRQLAAVALVSLAAFVALAGWARYLSVAGWEAQLVLALAQVGEPLAGVLRLISVLGDLPVWTPLVALGALLVYSVRGLIAGLVVALTLTSDLVAAVVKALVERSRPPDAIVDHFLGGESYAFPSGHVVRVAALVAVVVWLFAPLRWRLPAALAAAAATGSLMGFSRIVLGVHWPTDVLGGVLLALGWFGAAGWLVYRSREVG